MRASPGATTTLAVRDRVLSLRGDELGRLLEALVRLDSREADAVAEQIAALRLAGGVIRLTPTEAELAVLELGLAALAEDPPLGGELMRLAARRADGSPSGGKAS